MHSPQPSLVCVVLPFNEELHLARCLESVLRIAQKIVVVDSLSTDGSLANEFSRQGWNVTGVDPSTEGISQANARRPGLKLEHGSAYDDLATTYGRFPVVTSLEVVEHVCFPRRWATTLFSLLEQAGTAIVSTPYHGYWKNLAMAITGTMDAHFTALWDHGHIKFWSVGTLGKSLREAGFDDIRFERVGRIPALAKSMIAIPRRP